jgi:ubiquinone/menaquinone biosynthesis C-methylase UbiE
VFANRLSQILIRLLTIATSNVKAGDKVLDIAGGTGDLARAFAMKVGATGQVVLSIKIVEFFQ